MDTLSDITLLDEVRKRFEAHRKALYDLRMVTRKLEDVNEKLQQSEALKSNFLSNIRNEINNPLASLLVLSRELTYGNCETVQAIGNTLYSELFTLDFQLKNIITAAEIEAGETELGISRVDIDTLMRRTVDSFEHRVQEKKVTVAYDYLPGPDDGSFFWTDPSKFQTIFSNLLANAIEYSYEGGQVGIKAWRSDKHLNVIVEDFGVGLDEEEVSVIFDRFRQLDTGLSRRHKGHGLGLSVTSALVDLLYGTVSVVCKRGEGCIFTLFLPAAAPPAETGTTSADGNEFFFEEGERF
ncbi:MAG: HAMP domain-containing histidine kinase [Alphaproteobacteria bacterium]|uniref:histidine kinase n=1 Tax=Candidatus Nitrobium versatile TaxID=2884831 RepID=A0A953J573_9BACT|nr:HAMP domain-containing histidine kinase [Candidatus Nitrobium versatile]